MQKRLPDRVADDFLIRIFLIQFRVIEQILYHCLMGESFLNGKVK